MTNPDPELLDRIATEAEHAESTRDAELPYRRRKGGTHPVYGLRLPAERIEQLRRIAEARGIEPSAPATRRAPQNMTEDRSSPSTVARMLGSIPPLVGC